MNSVLFSVSTSVNLNIFGKSFIYSSVLNKNRTYIHIINMTKEDKIFLDKIKETTDLFSYSYSNINFSKVKKENIDTYLTFLKYELFINLLETNRKVSIFYIDINSLIRTTIIPPAQDIGILIKKKYNLDSMKNVASVFYSNFKGIDYWKNVCDTLYKNITDNNFVWFFDQKIIQDTQNTLGNAERIFSFPQEYCDWKCGRYSPIWVLKGDKKNYKDLSPTASSLFKVSNRNEREGYSFIEKQEYYNVRFVHLKIFYENIKTL